MLNWDTADPMNPSLAELADTPRKAMLGGLDRKLMLERDQVPALLAQARKVVASMTGWPFVLGANCAIESASLPEAVRAVRDFVEEH